MRSEPKGCLHPWSVDTKITPRYSEVFRKSASDTNWREFLGQSPSMPNRILVRFSWRLVCVLLAQERNEPGAG